ncbi:MAG TPA: acyltransferase, partial [Chlamydiales bacterium]|nr:acyltransferase [Chlamydiales bacterium]
MAVRRRQNRFWKHERYYMETKTVKALRHERKIIECSVRDHFTFRMPVSVVFFYPQFVDPIVLTRALEHVLGDFPLFAGVLVKKDGQLYIDCNNQGVSVTSASVKLPFAHSLTRLPNLPANTFVDLLNPFTALRQQQPVLTIKISHCPDGTAIGYCWNHVIGDLSSFMELQKALSAHILGKTYEKPIIPENREPYFLRWEKELPPTQGPSKLKRMKMGDMFSLLKAIYSPKRNVFIQFTQDEVTAMKATLSEQAGCKLSRNDAVCAHLLHLLAQCRTDQSETHYATIPIDFRRHAGIPQNTLGNCVDAVML